jgi:hypothetical protein
MGIDTVNYSWWEGWRDISRALSWTNRTSKEQIQRRAEQREVCWSSSLSPFFFNLFVLCRQIASLLSLLDSEDSVWLVWLVRSHLFVIISRICAMPQAVLWATSNRAFGRATAFTPTFNNTCLRILLSGSGICS